MLDNINQNQTNLRGKKLYMEISNENNKIFCNRSRSIRLDIEYLKRRKINIVKELLTDEKLNSKNSINEEFNINEEIKIPINENLLYRNIPKSILLNKENIVQIQKTNNINEQNSEKVMFSEKYSNNDFNFILKIIDKNNNQININKLGNYNKIFENKNLIPDSIIKDMQITSIYNNLHSLNNNYYLNKDLSRNDQTVVNRK